MKIDFYNVKALFDNHSKASNTAFCFPQNKKKIYPLALISLLADVFMLLTIGCLLTERSI